MLGNYLYFRSRTRASLSRTDISPGIAVMVGGDTDRWIGMTLGRILQEKDLP